MTKMWTLAILLFALPVLGDHERTFRCLTSKDKASNILVPELLRNLSSCAYDNQGWQTLPCAEKQIHPAVVSLTSPLISTIRRWQAHFNIEINTAFEQQEDWDRKDVYLNRPQLGLTAWDILLDSWLDKGELCYYNGDPKFADHLLPRYAGLLSLFILRMELRPPILKIGKAWKFDQKTTCSAPMGTPRALHQLRIIHAILQQVGTMSWRVEGEASHYREVYSTDPFLQGLFSGWRNTAFPCPEKMECQDTRPEKGKVYLPHHGIGYLHEISEIILRSQKVCLLFGKAPLDRDAYYFGVQNVDSEAHISV